MKPTLQFRLSQHLTLTPQLQQSIRLLQLSTVELNQEIERLLMDNPILEREESEPESAAGNAPRSESVASDAPAAPSGDAAPEPERSAEELPADYAAPWRGQEDDGEDGDRTLAGLLIDALDDDGYLTQPLDEIAMLLPVDAEVAPEELAIALRHLQN